MSGTDIELANVDQAKVLQALGLNISDPKAQATLLICQRYDLDPFLGQMQLVQNKPYITRDGYLHVAHRSGKFDGMDLLEEGENDRFWWCKVAVYRKDMSRPFTAVGRVKKGEKTQADPWDMALTRAERRALRRAFDVAGVHEADIDELEHNGPLPGGEEPFDTTSVEAQPALPASTSTKQAAEQSRQTLAERAAQVKSNDPVSKAEVDELLARLGGFDLEHRQMAADRMKGYGLTLKKIPNRTDFDAIRVIADSVNAYQADAWEKRRVAVVVELPDGISDDDRHALFAAATKDVPEEDGGPTESMKRLTDAQCNAILDYLATPEVVGEAS